jgi:hypothetical protein
MRIIEYEKCKKDEMLKEEEEKKEEKNDENVFIIMFDCSNDE